MHNYAENLKEHRLSRGLTLINIEKATGISNENVSRWENGKAIPGINFCIQLAQFYGITLDELVGLSETPNLKQNLPTQQQRAVVAFTDEYADIISDNNFVSISKLYKAVKPELRGLMLGYIIGLLQSNGVNTKSILGY